MPDGYGDLWNMIDKRLEGLEQGQNTIKTDVAVIKDRQAQVISDISGVKTTLYGNGRPGLVTQIALNKQQIGLFSTIMGSLGGILTGLLVSVLKGK